MWTLGIKVINGKKNICYCIFGVYLVTGTNNPDISPRSNIPEFQNIFLYHHLGYSK
jgi:hypothetical protein